MNVQAYYRSPFAPRIHFDEAGAGGDAAKPWFDGMDAEILGHFDNKGWKKDDPKALVTEVAKAWKGLEKHFGAPADRILKLPEKADDAAGWNAVRERLGMPKEAKDYDFTGVKYADGSDLEQSFTDAMRSALHKTGATKESATDVVKAVVKFLGDADAAEASERKAKLTAQQTALKQEWGQHFDMNQLTAMQGARRAAGSDEAGKALIDAMEQAIGYKATMEFWHKIGKGTTEDTFHEGGTGGSPTTRNGALARIAELEGDKEWVARFLKGGSKERQEMDSLLQQVHGVAA